MFFLFSSFLQIGSPLQCNKCSGDLQECNSDTASKVNCLSGFTRCASMVTNNADDGMHFTFGCAKPLDCTAASSACAELMKNNPGTSCNASCCSTDNCVVPYSKGGSHVKNQLKTGLKIYTII